MSQEVAVLKKTKKEEIRTKKVSNLSRNNIIENTKKPTGFDHEIPYNICNAVDKISAIISHEISTQMENLTNAVNRVIMETGEYNEPVNLFPPFVQAKVKPQDLNEPNGPFIFNSHIYFQIRLPKGVNIFSNNKPKISMKTSWTGTDFTPEILIDFNFECPKKELEDTFSYCLIDYECVFNTKPKQITTYIWNEDPVGSRGTVTTVQQPTS